MPAFARAILIQESAEGGLSYKETKKPKTLEFTRILDLSEQGMRESNSR